MRTKCQIFELTQKEMRWQELGKEGKSPVFAMSGYHFLYEKERNTANELVRSRKHLG